MSFIKVVIKKVGEKPFVGEIENELEAMQEFVGGYIEAVPQANGILLVCNEEGRLEGLPYNFTIRNSGFDMDIVGDVFFCETDGEEFTEISEDNAEYLLAGFGA